MDQLNNIETEFKSLRNRKISNEMKVSNAQINLYLDDRMSSTEKKTFVSSLAECKISQSVLEKKKSEREFIEDLIPSPSFSLTKRAGLTQELADVGEAILVDSDSNIAKKIFNFLRTPII